MHDTWPADGDILIASDSSGYYTLSVFPKRPQVRYKDFSQAHAMAEKVATIQNVRIWRTTDAGLTFSCLSQSWRSKDVG
jgi:hypothetical protein